MPAMKTCRPITKPAPACGLSPRGSGARGLFNWSKFQPTARFMTTSWRIGCPKAPATAGQTFSFDYALSWGKGPRPPLARVVSTRIGRQFDHDATKFVIDFQSPNDVQQSADATHASWSCRRVSVRSPIRSSCLTRIPGAGVWLSTSGRARHRA
jgi:glucan biosynthesis protein